MKHGEVMERGNHEELINLDGVYKQLVSRQLVAEELDDDKGQNETEVADPAKD